MEEPLVSVLLASYNHEKYVEAAVRSIMEQKGVAFELLVIDDGSSDSSPEILERLSRELNFKYRHRPNKGFVPTLNELLSEARGKYFCTFASDDIMAPGRLSLQSAYLKAHPEKVACAGLVRIFRADGSLEEQPDSRYAKVKNASFEDILLGNAELHGESEMIVREKFAELGNYDESFRFEDLPTWLALSDRFGDIPVLPVICSYYRDLPTSMHRNLNFIYSEILAVVNRYADRPVGKKAKNRWKTRWFSSLAYSQKKEAFRLLPKLANASLFFWKHFPKLFVPQKFLKY